MINIDQHSGITVYIRLQGEANNHGPHSTETTAVSMSGTVQAPNNARATRLDHVS